MIEHVAADATADMWTRLSDMHILGWLFVYALAATRLTRLIAQDAILDRPRTWVTLRTDGTRAEPLGYLVNCPWCVGVWVAAGLTVAVALFHGSPWLWWPIIGLYLAQVAGMLTTTART